MKRELILAVLTVLVAAGFLSVTAHADTLIFTLGTPVVSVEAGGDTFTFEATASAPASNGAALNLNGDSFTFPLALDDADFFEFWPLSLNPGDSFADDLFSVFVPDGTLPGDYVGSFSLLGGPDGEDDVLGSVVVTTTVTGATVIPEPSGFLLMGTGLAGAFMSLKREHLSRV
jgi:hypothetical protein